MIGEGVVEGVAGQSRVRAVQPIGLVGDGAAAARCLRPLFIIGKKGTEQGVP